MRFPAVDRQFPHLDCAADSAAGLALMRAFAETAFAGKHVDFRKHPLQPVLRRPYSQLAHSHRIDRKRAVRKREQFTSYGRTPASTVVSQTVRRLNILTGQSVDQRGIARAE